jgi:hypothetical protein
MGPLNAMDLLLTLPMEGASEEPCHLHNPDLWAAWCQAKGRDATDPTDVWSEIDVAISAELMLKKYIRERVTGERTE